MLRAHSSQTDYCRCLYNAHYFERITPMVQTRHKRHSMYISASQIPAAKVFDSEGHQLGQLSRVHLDAQNGSILAFEIAVKGPRFISPQDIINWKTEYLTLGQEYEIHDAVDLVRLAQSLKDAGGDLIGKKVRTEGGTKLGLVSDYTLNSKQLVLSSITVQKNFLGLFHFDTRLIHQKNILEIKPRLIIVRESWMKVPAQNSPEQFGLQKSPTLDRALSVPEDHTFA